MANGPLSKQGWTRLHSTSSVRAGVGNRGSLRNPLPLWKALCSQTAKAEGATASTPPDSWCSYPHFITFIFSLSFEKASLRRQCPALCTRSACCCGCCCRSCCWCSGRRSCWCGCRCGCRCWCRCSLTFSIFFDLFLHLLDLLHLFLLSVFHLRSLSFASSPAPASRTQQPLLLPLSLFVLGLLQASFLRTRLCDELRIGTLLHSPVDGRDEQLHLSHAHRALETTFSQPAMLLALRLRLLVGFILRLLVCFDLGSSLLVCFSLGCSLQSTVFYVFSAFLSQYLRTCFLLRLFVCFLLR